MTPINPLRPQDQHPVQQAAIERVMKKACHLFKEEETQRIFQEVLLRSLLLERPRARL